MGFGWGLERGGAEAEGLFELDGDKGGDGLEQGGIAPALFLELCGVDVVEVEGVAAAALHGLDEGDCVQDLVVLAAAEVVGVTREHDRAVVLDPEAEHVLPGLGLGLEELGVGGGADGVVVGEEGGEVPGPGGADAGVGAGGAGVARRGGEAAVALDAFGQGPHVVEAVHDLGLVVDGAGFALAAVVVEDDPDGLHIEQSLVLRYLYEFPALGVINPDRAGVEQALEWVGAAPAGLVVGDDGDAV